ncbi:uncharacterized protein LOC131650391 [Vicia villosa]|uniref:uncharacterized protein LOC131650391 n=1 Tax=Vicia villosa TaxID=3911 RepID=UPI00273C2ECB|nr:uncharacterized protein LOC131650391 [Vicia villosa]
MDPGDINSTHIALIPKCKNPATQKDFRPISLCNVVMKMVSKTIANCIKKILSEIVDGEQSGFVSDRLITDNALVSMECFHWLKKKKGNRGVLALKLDMSKAYDRLEWPFVVEPSRGFTPKRGLRQGDPFSLYLFIICVDVLSSFLKKEALEKRIHGIQVARQEPVITHLIFADESLLFSRATCQETDKIMTTLKSYQLSSGQVVNLDKSEVSFSQNVHKRIEL